MQFSYAGLASIFQMILIMTAVLVKERVTIPGVGINAKLSLKPLSKSVASVFN